jgi:mannose-1-phosphate guanylyltransferase
MLHAVIMAGGSGTRFWPMSRQNRPKHLLPLVGHKTLIQQTAERIAPLVPAQRTWVITATDQAAEVRRQLAELPAELIVGEPCKRDTAPCIGLAATLIARRDPAATLAVMPADHAIEPRDELCRTIELASRLIADDPQRLVTIGIKPARPATGYGYIHRGAPLAGYDAAVFAVQAFREKPARELAEQYLRSGEFYWNSGIFVWSAQTILRELLQSRPAVHTAVTRIGAAWDGPERDAVFAREYEAVERISIDYAVMERAKNVVVVEATFRWDDVGSWGSIQRLLAATADGNTVVGMHCGLDTRDSIVVTDAGRLVATVGVSNLLVVQSGNAILVADKRQEESVKRLVELMSTQGFETYL